MPDLPVHAEPRTNAQRVNHVLVYCNALSHGLIFERGKDGRPEDACTTVYLNFIIMGDVIPLPVVPPPSDWEQKPSQGKSISRE